MDFLSFLCLTKKQDDKDLSSFIDAIKKIEGIPHSSDPRLLGRFLYRKLNRQQTSGFQKWFLFYKSFDKKNEIPEDIKDEVAFLQAISLIELLQNSDPDYKW